VNKITQCEICGKHFRGRPDKGTCPACEKKRNDFGEKGNSGDRHTFNEDVKPLPKMTERRRKKIKKKEQKYNDKYFSGYKAE